MHEKDNYLKTAELSTEQNCNMIDGVPNNTPIPPTPPELDAKPLDKVKEPKERRKGRELSSQNTVFHELQTTNLTYTNNYYSQILRQHQQTNIRFLSNNCRTYVCFVLY